MDHVFNNDSFATVTITGNEVVRKIKPQYQDQVKSIYSKIAADLPKLQIIATKIDESSGLRLSHPKIDFISYPHEWCPSMLKEAALFQLQLAKSLLAKDLYLKDAHPWNILFQQGQPVFVDFTSIVDSELLFKEEFLNSNKNSNSNKSERLAAVTHEIYERMFHPFFVKPLLAYAAGYSAEVRFEIEETTLNATTRGFNKKLLFPLKSNFRTYLPRWFALLKSELKRKQIYDQLLKGEDLSVFFQQMIELVAAVDVNREFAGYAQYYQKKGEEISLEPNADWNFKQKNIYSILQRAELKTVLDLASNTGWFSRLAEKQKKTVVAFDIDEGCVESLHSRTKNEKLNILALLANFSKLSKEKKSLHNQQTLLIDATERLSSDLVMALAVVHHLVLGQGMTVDAVVDGFSSLTKNTLILEWVSDRDALIVSEPTFFPEMIRNPKIVDGYSKEAWIKSLNRYYTKIEEVPSFPETRLLLVCQK